jgi:prolyl oligopeptidase
VADSQWGGVTFSTASRYALAWVALNPGNAAFDFYTAPLEALAGGDTEWRRLAGGEDQVAEVVLRGDDAYLVTSRHAPRRQVVRTPILHPDLARAEVVVAQSEAVVAPPLAPADIIWSALYLANDALYVRLQEAGVSRLLRLPFDGSARGVVPLPFPGAVHDISADPDEPGLAFALESWVRAPRFYSFDPKAGTVRDIHLLPPHPAERPGFEVIETRARSADGTMVPLTIIGQANLKKDGSHPTRVQGYGAYGMVPEPTFRPLILPWLERGGIDAVCHPRGGGDYGEEWHAAGQKRNKANTIADFVACAEYLVAEGYTTHARLAGTGASAGGITIGGAITSRPDLFAAALPAVPVSDLLRMEFTRFGPANIPEFGTVADPDDFRAMLMVSPYEHIRNGTKYPAVMVSTSINDISVPTWQPAKLVARLQAATASGKPVLLRVDWGSGHFGGTTTGDQETQVADSFSFMLWQMDVAGFQPPGDKR